MRIRPCRRGAGADGERKGRRAEGVGGFGSIAFPPHDVARALGSFEAEGLEVDSRYLRSGSHAATVLLSGDADRAAASLDHVVEASLPSTAGSPGARNGGPGSLAASRRNGRCRLGCASRSRAAGHRPSG